MVLSAKPAYAPSAERAATFRRIPSLDGLRAVSILMVTGLHTLQAELSFFLVERPSFRLRRRLLSHLPLHNPPQAAPLPAFTLSVVE